MFQEEGVTRSWTPIAKRHESIEQPQPCRRVTLKKLAESEANDEKTSEK